MSPRPKPGILDIAPYVPGKSRAVGIASPIKLSANENALGCSPRARQAYVEAANSLQLYPDPRASRLREAIAAQFAIEPGRIVFGTGSDEIFSMLCQAYLAPGDEIIQPQHGFAAWAIAARAAGGSVISVPERADTVDVEAMIHAVTPRTRLVFVANPANPTGTYIGFDDVRRLHAALPPNVILVLDGAYAEYASALPDFADGIDYARAQDNVVITRTFSKLHGLASLRIGWGYAPAEIADALERFRLPFNVSRPAEAAAIAALQDNEFISQSLAHAQAGREVLRAAFADAGLAPIPSAANFVAVRFPETARLTAAGAEAALAERGILVRGLKNYHLPDCLRVTVGTPSELNRLIEVLRAIL